MNAFKRKIGLRIDHILVSDELARTLRGQPHSIKTCARWSGRPTTRR